MFFSTFANTRKGEWSEILASSQNNTNLREQWACWRVRLPFRERGWAGRREGAWEYHELSKGKSKVLWDVINPAAPQAGSRGGDGWQAGISLDLASQPTRFKLHSWSCSQVPSQSSRHQHCKLSAAQLMKRWSTMQEAGQNWYGESCSR